MVKPVRKVNHKRVIRLPPPKVSMPTREPEPIPLPVQSSPYNLPLPPSSREEELLGQLLEAKDKVLDEKDKRIDDLKELGKASVPVQQVKESPDKWKHGVTVIKIIFAPPGKMESNFEKFTYLLKLVLVFGVAGMIIALVILFR